MNAQFAAALAVLPEYLGAHVLLSLAAIALGAAASLPLGVLAARNGRLRGPVLAFASLAQTIPALALVALFYPLLLALSGLTREAFGFATPALGFLPALLALALYAMLPILRNTVAGLDGVDPAILEAADAVGMTATQKLWRVQLPLAAPVVMAGLRTAMVWTIGGATLATPVGQTSLGNYIFSGLQTENWVSVLFGCFASAALALIADQLLGLIERGAARRDGRRIALGAGAFAAAALAALAPLGAHATGAYVIGAKNFSEQYILADLIARELRAHGLASARREGLGSAVVYRALAADDIDAYVDYSGTIWTNVMKRADNPPREKMLDEMKAWLAAHDRVTLFGALGFENAYAFAMKKSRAQQLHVATLDDLSRAAPDLVLGADLEFLSRPEWTAAQKAYALRFRDARAFNPTFMYRALVDGSVDVISAFSSDGRILADDLVTLADPRGALPHYDAILLLAPRRAGDQKLRSALEPLIGAIDLDRMRRANLEVDRDKDKLTPAEAAARLADGAGLAKR
ncbi:MAG: ABC transporter permease/substrate-binding protein [Hyphomicrobiales bacterium]|nr:ABC transporter permease/substrate-binding protein [Hyphomicrobiales bacterium]